MAAYDDPRVKPHVRAVAREIKDRFDISNIGGFATTGHITNSDHYRGLALDVMTSIRGQEVANWAQANAQRLSITYIIWNRRIWDSRNSKGWQPYSGTSPHTDHVHLSFFPTAGDGSPPVEGSAGSASGTDPVSQAKDGCSSLVLKLFGLG